MAAAPPSRNRAGWTAATTALVAGVLARAVLLWLAPSYGFTGDHVDYVCWGRQAVSSGVLDVYRKPPGPCVGEYVIDGVRQRRDGGSSERLNYPALAAYVFWAEGHVLRVLDPAMVGNTLTSRIVFAISTTIAELVTAFGVLVLVRRFAGPSAASTAFAATWLAPPLLLDGPFWGQTEAWVLAPAVWMLIAMIDGRWLAAGVLWGVALALKPSGLLFAPLWLYAFLFRAPRTSVLAGGVAAVAVVHVFALPFWVDSGTAWLESAFLDNYVYRLQWTTAMAFNVWYVDLLSTGVLDPRVPLLGMSRDLWGMLLLALGLAGAYALVRLWERRHPESAALGFLPLATLVTLAAVMLPTRVHSTYGAFTTPFLIATAFLVPATVYGVGVLLVTISLQILSWQWAQLLAMHVLPDETFFKPEVRARRQAMREHDRPREWALTIANLGAAAAVAAAIAAASRPPGRRDA